MKCQNYLRVHAIKQKSFRRHKQARFSSAIYIWYIKDNKYCLKHYTHTLFMTMEMFFNLPTMIISALLIYSKHFQLVKAFSERLFPALTIFC